MSADGTVAEAVTRLASTLAQPLDALLEAIPAVVKPGGRVVVNLPEHRLYYYPKPKRGEKPVVITYPVSIGKMDWTTPIGAASSHTPARRSLCLL